MNTPMELARSLADQVRFGGYEENVLLLAKEIEKDRNRSLLAVAEQRCERGTPWDLAIVASMNAIKPGSAVFEPRKQGELHSHKPIWVWCYITSELRDGRDGMPPLSAWPQAHTYAFLSESEALAHPDAMKWGKAHGYTLQRVYLQDDQLTPVHSTGYGKGD